MRGSERISVAETEIVVEVFTSALSPRRFAAFAPNSDQSATKGVSLKRFSDLFVLTFSPEFNQSLPTGVFTITLHYNLNGTWITNRVVTEKFVNDLPGDMNAFKKHYNPSEEELRLAYNFR